MTSRNYRDLIVWQKAMDLVVDAYQITREFPQEEIYGLTSQIRRAVVSIPSNIAEGQGRGSEKEFRRYLAIAYGSLQETETQLLLAQRLDYINVNQTRKLMNSCSEVGKLINGLSNSLKADN